MRAYEFLLENDTSEYTELIELLKSKCQPYLAVLKQSHKQPLFRGIRGELSDLYAVVKPRVDRKPSDIPVEIHNALNHAFNEQFGFPYRNGIFCTGRMADAQDYGTAVVVFPVGELEYTWSSLSRDLFQTINGDYDSRKYERVTDPFPEHKQGEPDWVVNKEKVANLVSRYKTNMLPLAIQSHNEVMLANECILVSIETYKQIINSLMETK